MRLWTGNQSGVEHHKAASFSYRLIKRVDLITSFPHQHHFKVINDAAAAYFMAQYQQQGSIHGSNCWSIYNENTEKLFTSPFVFYGGLQQV